MNAINLMRKARPYSVLFYKHNSVRELILGFAVLLRTFEAFGNKAFPVLTLTFNLSVPVCVVALNLTLCFSLFCQSDK